MRNEKKTVSDLAGDTLAASAFANPTTPHGKHRASGDGRVMTTAANITRAILADRVQRRGRSPKIERARTEGPAFDPFAFTRWRVVAPVGGDPGYLVKTPMRRGAVGWFIACRCCGREFESRGLAFCESCMALPAEERRKPLHGRPCQVPGCMAKISPRRRSDARYCEHHSAGRNGAKVVFSGVKVGRQPAGEKYDATREIPEQNQGPILGPKIWPINVVGGHRRPDDLTLDSALVGAILQCEVAS